MSFCVSSSYSRNCNQISSLRSVHLSSLAERKRAPRHVQHAVADRCDSDVAAGACETHGSGHKVTQQGGMSHPDGKCREDGLASTAWIFAGAQPKNALRDALSRSPPSMPGGRAGGWFVAAGVVVVAAKAVHWSVVRRCKGCTTCRGYGIQRCNLCGASGAVTWTGKWDHVEPCPACLGMRFSSCPDCGGFYHRPMFQHVSRNSGLQASQDQALTTVDVISPMVD